MSDYSFMKSGFSTNSNQTLTSNEIENIQNLLALFTSNAMINASKYARISNRNGITKEDLQYGLRYEVFEFFNKQIEDELYEIKNDMIELENEEPKKYKIEYLDNRVGVIEQYETLFDTELQAQEIIDELKYYNYFQDFVIIGLTESDLQLDEIIFDDNEIDTFKRIDVSLITNDNKEFVSKIHTYYDKWDTWEPQTPIEKILKNAISIM